MASNSDMIGFVAISSFTFVCMFCNKWQHYIHIYYCSGRLTQQRYY